MNGDGRREEDWGFYPDLSRKPVNLDRQRKRKAREMSGRRPIGGQQRQADGEGRGPGGGQQAPGSRERSRIIAVAVLVLAAAVIIVTGMVMSRGNASGSGDTIDWELMPLSPDAATSTTG